MKKRKNEKIYTDFIKKKSKFNIEKDSNGNIKFPVHINNSIKLLAVGKINSSLAFHSDYNLFPVGFKTIRTHASMFNKG